MTIRLKLELRVVLLVRQLIGRRLVSIESHRQLITLLVDAGHASVFEVDNVTDLPIADEAS
jgi:hypothetical protein